MNDFPLTGGGRRGASSREEVNAHRAKLGQSPLTPEQFAEYVVGPVGLDIDDDNPEWSGERLYQRRAAVRDAGSFYRARRPTSGERPSETPDAWAVVVQGVDLTFAEQAKSEIEALGEQKKAEVEDLGGQQIAAAGEQAGLALSRANTAGGHATAADASRAAALAAKVAAESARDVAFGNAEVFASTAAGLAGTTNGAQFQVIEGAYIVRYRNNAGAAVEVARLRNGASLSAVDNTADAVKPVSAPQAVEIAAAVDVGSRPARPTTLFVGGLGEEETAALEMGGRAVALYGEDGRLIRPVQTAFVGGVAEDEGFELVLDGRRLLSFDARGDMITPPAQAGASFVSGLDEGGSTVVTIGGRKLLEISDGKLVYPEAGGAGPAPEPVATGTPLVPYLSSNVLRAVGARDHVLADLASTTALHIAPGTRYHVQVVINRPSRDGVTAVAAGPRHPGKLIPMSDQVIHILLIIGQSLSVGSQSGDTLITTEQPWPEDALMFRRADGKSGLRLGIDLQSASTVSILDPEDLIGFEPLVAKVGPGGSGPGLGQTIAESCATLLSQIAREIGIRYRSLSINTGIGGAGYSAIKKGSTTYSNMLAAVARAVELEEAQGRTVVVDAVLHKHGESDGSNSNYFANLLEWQTDIEADVKAITDQAAPVHFFMGVPSTFTQAIPHSRLAMLRAHQESPKHHVVGPDYPFMDVYAQDNLHMLGQGYFWVGEKMAQAVAEVCWSPTGARKKRVVQMVSATRTGTSVVINWEVPVPPLVFDTATVPERDVKGFQFFDSSGEIGIVSAVLTGPAQITLTLAAVPSGSGERVDYAMRQRAEAGTPDFPSGNVRDSDPFTSMHLDRPLWNWANHQRLSL